MILCYVLFLLPTRMKPFNIDEDDE